jgi:hypothetical protein
MVEAIGSSETPVLARATRRNIPEDDIRIEMIFTTELYWTIRAGQWSDSLDRKLLSQVRFEVL